MYTYRQLANSGAAAKKPADAAPEIDPKRKATDAAAPSAPGSDADDAQPRPDAPDRGGGRDEQGPWSRIVAEKRKQHILSSLAEQQDAPDAEPAEQPEPAEPAEHAPPALPVPQNAGLVPMQLRIFYRDTVYWISARVYPSLSWISLIELLVQALNEQHDLRLPATPFQYTYYNMDASIVLHPLDSIHHMLADEILFIHKSEFANAYDNNRRAKIIAEVIHDPTVRFARRDMEVVLSC